MNNIILIGMPACGKSTIGVVLAKTLGMQFVDTDLLIQQQEKELLQNITRARCPPPLRRRVPFPDISGSP